MRIYFALLFSSLLIACNEDPANRVLQYSEASNSSAELGGVDKITACSLSGPNSSVFIGTVVSSNWNEHTCGERLPDGHYNYSVRLERSILGIHPDVVDVTGLADLAWLNAPLGEEFVFAVREEEGFNVLVQWVKIESNDNEVSIVDSNELVDLPAEESALITAIRDSVGADCTPRFGEFLSDSSVFKADWGNTECDATITAPEEDEPTTGSDI